VKKLSIVGISFLALGGIILSLGIVFSFITHLAIEKINTPHCDTRMILVYGEPAKYNQTIIINALRDNLSKDDFRDYHGTFPWWKYVGFQQIDEHAIYIVIPSVDEKTINMTKSIISKIDGVGKIRSSETECITFPVGEESLMPFFAILSLIPIAIGSGIFFWIRSRK